MLLFCGFGVALAKRIGKCASPKGRQTMFNNHSKISWRVFIPTWVFCKCCQFFPDSWFAQDCITSSFGVLQDYPKIFVKTTLIHSRKNMSHVLFLTKTICNTKTNKKHLQGFAAQPKSEAFFGCHETREPNVGRIVTHLQYSPDCTEICEVFFFSHTKIYPPKKMIQ